MKRRLTIANLILLAAFGVTLLSLAFVGYIWILQERERFLEETEAMKFNYITTQKQLLKKEVERAIRYIRFYEAQAVERIHERLKNHVYEAHTLAMSIWRANRDRKSEAEIIQMIRTALSDIRFNNGRGYYFATRTDGIVQIFADRPAEEGKNYLDVKDTNGKYFVREMIRVAREETEGFVTYCITKPKVAGDAHPKLAFVKLFEPYNWYIGTGDYREDFETDIKEEVLKVIQSVEYGRDGYIFAGQWDGVSLSGPAVGKNMFDVTDINGVKIVQELIRAAQEGGGFVSYAMPKLNGKKHAEKISYAEGLYKWQWYIGAGVYLDEIDQAIIEKRSLMEAQIRERIASIIGILLFCLLTILVLARTVSGRVQKNLNSLMEFFRISSTTATPIDLERLSFPEFHQLADSANRMVDERNRSNQALKENEEQLRVILNSVKIGIVIIDPETHQIVSANPYVQELVGLSESEILGCTCNKFICLHKLGNCPVKLGNVADLLDDKYVRSAEGKKIPIVKSATRIIYRGKEHFLESFIDITDLKEREREIRKLRNYLQSIIDSMPSAIIGVDGRGNVTQFNAEAGAIFDVEAKTATGRYWRELVGTLPIDPDEVEAAVAKKQPWVAENVKWTTSSGKKHFDITVFPLLEGDKGGAVVRIDDTTERVRMSELLIQTEKMISVGGLAAGMAHEINNPLAAIIQSVQLLQRRLKTDSRAMTEISSKAGASAEEIYNALEDQKIHKLISAINESGLRAARIVSNMLSFAKKSEYNMAMHEIAELLENTIELAANDYDLKQHFDFKKIAIDKSFDASTPLIMCEGGQIQQVILNILKNGAYAMMSVGDIEKPCFQLRIRNNADTVSIEIEDNGPGMPDEVKRRVFEPFFTTKKGNLGTGLGLSISYFIITENHKGNITVDSVAGRGTTFTITLPKRSGHA